LTDTNFVYYTPY